MKNKFICWFISDYIEIIKYIKRLIEKRRINKITNKQISY